MPERTYTCLTCGRREMPGFGNNPEPLTSNLPGALRGRRVCGDCNAIYVLPARMGHPIVVDLFDEAGHLLGTLASGAAAEQPNKERENEGNE